MRAAAWPPGWRTSIRTNADSFALVRHSMMLGLPPGSDSHAFRAPVLVCTAQHTGRYYWTRASFSGPDGLPTALSGQNEPVNPVTHENISAESAPSCG